MEINEITLAHDDHTEQQAAAVVVEVLPADMLDGVVVTAAANVDGPRVFALVAYPAADVAALNVSSLGSAVRNALLSVS